MEKFTTHTGVGVPLRRSNVDTDQIIPAVYLKRVTRTGFEDGLFAAWRDDPTLRAQPPGVRRRLGARRRSRLRHRLLARARRVGAAELRLQGRHLARASPTSSAATPASPDWSPRRSTRRSCSGSGTTSRTTPARPSPSTWSREPSRLVRVDAIEDSFDIDDYTRWRLLEGLDDIGITLSHDDDIAAFESHASVVEAGHNPLISTGRFLGRTGHVANNCDDTRTFHCGDCSLFPSVQGISRARRSADVHEREACEQESVDRRPRGPLRRQPQGGRARAGVGARHHHPRGRQGREGRHHRLRLLREEGARRALGAQPLHRCSG